MANVASNTTENAARDAWQSFLGAHPRLHGFLSLLGSFFGYFLNGHIVVAFVQWLVRVAGRIAESALLLATLYVTLNNVAHVMVTWVLPTNVINALNYLSLVAFSLLPELIVAAAIKITVDHWMMFSRHTTWRNPAWVWATLYTLPTVTFVVMTVSTLSSFVNTAASSGNVAQATGTALTIRFLAGWGYAMVEILFATIGKKSYVAMLDSLRAMVATQGQELSILKNTEQELRKEIKKATDERDHHQGLWATATTSLQEAKATVATQAQEIANHHASIARIQEEKQAMEMGYQARIQELQEQSEATIAHIQEELRATKEKLSRATALKRSSSSRAMVATTPQTVAIAPQPTTGYVASGEQATEEKTTGYVASDDGQTMAIANGYGDTLIVTGSHRERIKEAMARALANGEDLSYVAIAEAARTGYSTVKKYAKELQAEIARESTGDMGVIVIEQD